MANARFTNYGRHNFGDEIETNEFQNQIDTSTPLNPLPKNSKDQILQDGIIHDDRFSMDLRDENINQDGMLHDYLGPSFVTPILNDSQRRNLKKEVFFTKRAAIPNYETHNMTRIGEKPPTLRDTLSSDESSKTPIFLNPWRPYVLLLYLHFATNLILLIVAAYLGYVMISTIRADINSKIKLCISNTLSEISECSKEYYQNKCFNDENNKRAPALEQTCAAWERCMNTDPQQLAKSKITAEALAEILNSFLGQLSWKSLFLLFSLLLGSFLISQATFGRLHTAWTDDQLMEVNQRLRTLENELRESNTKQAALLIDNKNVVLSNDQFRAERLLSMSTSIMPLSSPLADRYIRKKK